MFFRKFKSTMVGAPAPAVQKMIGLTFGLVIVWFVFASNSPLNKGAKKPPDSAATERGSSATPLGRRADRSLDPCAEGAFAGRRLDEPRHHRLAGRARTRRPHRGA